MGVSLVSGEGLVVNVVRLDIVIRVGIAEVAKNVDIGFEHFAWVLFQ